MRCPECRDEHTTVRDSRPNEQGMIRRRRQCVCGHRFTTYEVVGEEVRKGGDGRAHVFIVGSGGVRSVNLVAIAGRITDSVRSMLSLELGNG